MLKVLRLLPEVSKCSTPFGITEENIVEITPHCARVL